MAEADPQIFESGEMMTNLLTFSCFLIGSSGNDPKFCRRFQDLWIVQPQALPHRAGDRSIEGQGRSSCVCSLYLMGEAGFSVDVLGQPAENY